MQKTVQSVEIDERAKVSDILHHTLANIARGHSLQNLRARLGSFLFNQFATTQDNVLSLLVNFYDLKLKRLAHECIKVPRRDHIHL